MLRSSILTSSMLTETLPTGLLPMNPVEFLVLAVLTDGPLHGYGLTGEIAARTGGRVRVRPGNLYRVLDRLAGKRLIAEVGDDPASGRRNYEITDLGRRAARAESELRARVVGASEGLRDLTGPA